LTAARWVDVAWSPLVLVQSLSPVAAALALLSMVGAAVYGRRPARIALAGTCVAVLSVQVAIWAPWLTAEPVRRGQDLTVMTVNLYRGNADIAAVSRIARAEDVDVLAVSEFSHAAVAGLRRSALDDLFPHAVGSEHGTSRTTLLLSRLPLRPLPTTAPDALGAIVRGQTARMPDMAGVIVAAVHPNHPVPRHVREWRSAQDELTDWAERTSGPTIVAGDFNASVDHPGMRRLLDAGLSDAHEVAGAGRPLTWPHGRGVPPFVQIDHVLVRGVDVESATDVRVPGSDHDAVVAHLVVPTGR
jgi:endonuclease/exonuclease/phosphatase (EEP) superfamily protein YafD